MSRKFFFALLLGILSFAQVAQGEECLSYEPAEVTIQGIIVRKTFPGPPGYESIEKGDSPETVWILNMHSERPARSLLRGASISLSPSACWLTLRTT